MNDNTLPTLMPEYRDPAAGPRAIKPAKNAHVPFVIAKVYVTPAEREALERRIGNDAGIACIAREFLAGDLLGLSPLKLPPRPPTRGTRKGLKVRIDAAQKTHLDEAARASNTSLSDYLVRRLFALPEQRVVRTKRKTLSRAAKHTLLLHLVSQRLDALGCTLDREKSTPVIRSSFLELAEAFWQLEKEMESQP